MGTEFPALPVDPVGPVVHIYLRDFKNQMELNETPAVVLEVAMNTASIPLSSVGVSQKIPFNFLTFGNELGTRAFDPMTSNITIPLTGTYRIFLDCTFANTSTVNAMKTYEVTVSVNDSVVFLNDKAIPGTVASSAGKTSVQTALVYGLSRGDVITFQASSTLAGGVSLQGVTGPNITPFPVTASVESFF